MTAGCSRNSRRFEEAAISDSNKRQPGGEQPDVDEQPQHELAVGGVEGGHAGAAEPAQPGAQRRQRAALRRQHQRRRRRHALAALLRHHVNDHHGKRTSLIVIPKPIFKGFWTTRPVDFHVDFDPKNCDYGSRDYEIGEEKYIYVCRD